MTVQQASYLMSLPLVLHVPHLHFFVVHAGLLPSDPRLSPTDPRQPLAHPPATDGRKDDMTILASGSGIRNGHYEYDNDEIIPSPLRFQLHAQSSMLHASKKSSQHRNSAASIEDRRALQESAILVDVPQNRDPWAVLNMRGVTKKNKVTRDGDKGTPWSKIWNKQMSRCRGFDGEDELNDFKKSGYALPCRPTTVVYGHAATRGLDVKRWSMGLDTGCLYGRRLTALVLTNGTALWDAEERPWLAEDEEREDEDEDDEDSDDEENEDEADEDDEDESVSRPKRRRIRFGDGGSGINAKLIHVNCPNIDD